MVMMVGSEEMEGIEERGCGVRVWSGEGVLERQESLVSCTVMYDQRNPSLFSNCLLDFIIPSSVVNRELLVDLVLVRS